VRPVGAAVVRLLAVLALLALPGGCAVVRITYNNADSLVRYLAHDYFDLDERQNERFKNALLRFHDWHRANELPLYAGVLRAAARRGEKGIDREDVAWAAAAIRARYRAFVHKAAGDAAPILVTLTPEQISELENRLARANDKYAREFLSGDEDGRLRAQAKRMLGRVEDWTGSLSEAQEDRIKHFVKAHLRTTRLRFEDRRRWQREVVGLIRRLRMPNELALRISDIFAQPARYRSPEYTHARARWESGLTDLILDIDRTLTGEQRAHFLARLRRFAEDFESLSGRRAVVVRSAVE